MSSKSKSPKKNASKTKAIPTLELSNKACANSMSISPHDSVQSTYVGHVIADAVDFNARLVDMRSRRAPFYYDQHTRTVQAMHINRASYNPTSSKLHTEEQNVLTTAQLDFEQGARELRDEHLHNIEQLYMRPRNALNTKQGVPSDAETGIEATQFLADVAEPLEPPRLPRSACDFYSEYMAPKVRVSQPKISDPELEGLLKGNFDSIQAEWREFYNAKAKADEQRYAAELRRYEYLCLYQARLTESFAFWDLNQQAPMIQYNVPSKLVLPIERMDGDSDASEESSGASDDDVEMDTNINAPLVVKDDVVPIISAVALSAQTVEERKASLIRVCNSCLQGKDRYQNSRFYTCSKCWRSYHGSPCLHYSPEIVQRIDELCKSENYEWTCAECKECRTCKQSLNDNLLVLCDMCDRGLHVYCMVPPLMSPPEGGWRCDACVQCQHCKSKSPGPRGSKWFRDYTMCARCYVLFSKGQFCPVCTIVYEEDEQKPMVCCDRCEKWVHIECDHISEEKYDQMTEDSNSKYFCPNCRAAGFGKKKRGRPARYDDEDDFEEDDDGAEEFRSSAKVYAYDDSVRKSRRSRKPRQVYNEGGGGEAVFSESPYKRQRL